ncbi:hypothetical protein MYP_2871 [Sporocytophaga myxococcoides]|uniref:Uncharacterized protein n=1 Tax=Sporocytophaga myxococcoides TaxID=153721 RepID=A0A098LGQ7_9BACT|nr:hypothetical protein [Sporocytophaga myxococcoides]GAL85642.1 hypothetical protein MYP_2871 [Sporocytophaga myxococcoides]
MNRDKNVLLNVLNVLKRISDENFISNYWGRAREGNSIVISCAEAFEILDDFFFFEILKENYGNWKEIVNNLSFQVVNELIVLAKQIISYENYEQTAEFLLKDSEWREIMNTSKRVAHMLEKELNVENDSSYLI